MANRRMFSLDVIDADKFLNMPIASQNLYFHLGMRADDDGFVSSPKKITKMLECSDSDLKVLISNGFLIDVGEGIIVITHWLQNNYIRQDRYKETVYKKQKEMLVIDDGVYQMATNGIPNGNQMETQVSIGKDSINILCAPKPHESELENQLKSDFDKIYAIYPKKVGKTNAFISYKKWISEKGRNIGGKHYRLNNRQIYFAVKKYVQQQEEAGQEDYQYWKNFDTLMGRQLLDYVEDVQ